MTMPVVTSSRPTGPGRGRAALGALVLVAAATAGTLAMRGGSDGSPPAAEETAPLFTTGERTVTYEVGGEGPVEEIAYVVGAGNRTLTVADPELPWRKEVRLDVGLAGGTALVTAANAGVDKLTCGVLVEGERVYQVTGQSETDVSCSAELPAATAG